MGCGCGKSFSSGNSYATGQRYKNTQTSHVPTQRPPAPTTTHIQSRSLQARTVQPQVASTGRRKV